MFEIDYPPRNKIVTALDPRLRILTYLIIALEISFINRIKLALIAFVVSTCAVVLLRINFTVLARRLLSVNIFIIFLWLILPITYPGNVLWKLWIFNITQEGILYCVLITLKSNAIFLLLFSLIGTMSSAEFGYALRAMHVSHKLSFLFLFSWRYLSVMSKELSLMLRAAKARAFEPQNSLTTYKTVAFMVGMLIIRAYERSKRIQWAMEARGFDGRYHSLRVFRLEGKDILFLLFSLLTSMFLGYLQWIR